MHMCVNSYLGKHPFCYSGSDSSPRKPLHWRCNNYCYAERGPSQFGLVMMKPAEWLVLYIYTYIHRYCNADHLCSQFRLICHEGREHTWYTHIYTTNKHIACRWIPSIRPSQRIVNMRSIPCESCSRERSQKVCCGAQKLCRYTRVCVYLYTHT